MKEFLKNLRESFRTEINKKELLLWAAIGLVVITVVLFVAGGYKFSLALVIESVAMTAVLVLMLVCVKGYGTFLDNYYEKGKKRFNKK